MTMTRGARVEGEYPRRSLGVAVIGCGRMGTHRARIAATHPAVRFLALVDTDLDKASKLADLTGAQLVTSDLSHAVLDRRVNCVIVSSPEDQHVEPALAAIAAGKDVLVEKPLATTLLEAAELVQKSEAAKVRMFVGYSQRFQRSVFLSKRFLAEGKLGEIAGGNARVLNSRAQALSIVDRVPQLSFIVDILTYTVDIIGWFMPGTRPIETYAAGAGDVIRDHRGGNGPDDLTNAIVKYDNGAVFGFSVCYSLPAGFPTMGQGVRLEVIGSDGVLLLDGDNRQNIVYSDQGLGHAYVPNHSIPMGFLGTTTPGDWALDTMFGPLAEETRSWLDHLATGVFTHLATPQDALQALRVTLAMQRSSEVGAPVMIQSAGA